jgi:arsenate reductase
MNITLGEFIYMSNGKKLLFVCIENAHRSQMAQGFAEAIGKGRFEVYSAGSQSSSRIDPLVIEVMKEKGIDLSGKRPKGLNDLPSVEVDYLITVGCGETCPAVPAKKIIEWQIPDPEGKSIDIFRSIRPLILIFAELLYSINQLDFYLRCGSKSFRRGERGGYFRDLFIDEGILV